MLFLITDARLLKYFFFFFYKTPLNNFYLIHVKFNFLYFFKKLWFKKFNLLSNFFNKITNKKFFKVFYFFDLNKNIINYNMIIDFNKILKNHKNTIFKYFFFNQIFHNFYIKTFMYNNFKYIQLIPLINMKNFFYKKNLKLFSFNLKFLRNLNNKNLLSYNFFL